MEKEKLVITKDNAHDYLGWFSSVEELIEKGKIDNTFGTGKTYTDNDGIVWHSRARLNKDGKLTVRALITTWAGAVAHASHYYAQLIVIPNWTNEDETVISYNPRAPKLPEINMSLGYYKEEGLFKNDDLTRFNGMMGIDQTITNRLKVGASMLITYKDNNKRQDPLNQANKIIRLLFFIINKQKGKQVFCQNPYREKRFSGPFILSCAIVLGKLFLIYYFYFLA